jgi:hypothetical protein
MIRRGVQLLLAMLFAIAILVNARLYGGTDADVAVPQLHFLRQALDRGTGEEMQGHFPEGYFFMHALYGAAWIEVGRGETAESELRIQARAEAQWALAQLESPTGRAPFAGELQPAHGVYYAGWINWLRGGALTLYADTERPADQWRMFTGQSASLAEAFDRSATPFLQSYPGRAWPVDSVVAMASLRLHDPLAPPRFEATRTQWLTQVRSRLDPATGLIPHEADPKTGAVAAGARGSSQALLLRFLLEIDADLGRAHYLAFRSQFVQPAWLLPGTREYPIGRDGPGDVDSGPLIAGISLSASVVHVTPARMVGDDNLANPYLNLGEAMGFPFSWNGRRRYLAGQVPIADAFLAYSRTATAWTDMPRSGFRRKYSPLGLATRLACHYAWGICHAGLSRGFAGPAKVHISPK